MSEIRADLYDRLLQLLSPAVGEHDPKTFHIDYEFNLVESGLLDSLAFLELISTIEEEHGIILDLYNVDPAIITNVGGLLRTVARAIEEKQIHLTRSHKNIHQG